MIVILHNIRSLYNIGSIFRTADAAGIEKIYLTGITPEPVDQFGRLRNDFAKVALGAEKTVEWEKIGSASTSSAAILRLIDKMKKEGYKIFAIEQSRKSTPYYKLNINPSTSSGRRCQLSKVVLIVGNEVNGLPQSVLSKCDKILEIPMRGSLIKQSSHPRHTGKGKESLNVAVSFGIVVFHLNYESTISLKHQSRGI